MRTKIRTSPSGPVSSFLASTVISHTPADADKVTENSGTPVPGARVGDVVIVNNVTTLPANLGIAGARVSAPNVVEVSLVNPTNGDIPSGAISYAVEVIQFA